MCDKLIMDQSTTCTVEPGSSGLQWAGKIWLCEQGGCIKGLR